MTPSSTTTEADRLLKDIVSRRNVDLDISNDADRRDTISKIIDAAQVAVNLTHPDFAADSEAQKETRLQIVGELWAGVLPADLDGLFHEIEAAFIQRELYGEAQAVTYMLSLRSEGDVDHQVRLVRRNRQIVPWSMSKIESAVRRAFISVHADPSPAVRIARAVTARVKADANSLVGIEDVQDMVQEELMKQAHYAVASHYILYRAERAKLRSETTDDAPAMSKITVVNGRTKAPFDPAEIRRRITYASTGLDLCLSKKEITKELLRSVGSEISKEDLKNTIILNAKTLLEKGADFGKFAGRILLTYIYEEVLDWDILRDGLGQLKKAHRQNFATNLKRGVKIGRIDPVILERYDLEELASKLDPSADMDFDYLGLQTLYDRYLIVDKTGKKARRLETPQFFWMRVAMGLFKEEGRPVADDLDGLWSPDDPATRINHAVSLYNLYKSRRFCSSTPTLFNSGTPHSQLSSCFPAGTPVETDSGFVPIEELEVGDLVRTHKGRLRQVLGKANKYSDQNLRALRVSGFLSKHAVLSPTADHPLLVIKRTAVACIRPTSKDSKSTCGSKRGEHRSCEAREGYFRDDCPKLSAPLSREGEWTPAGQVGVGDFVAVTFPTTVREAEHVYKLLDFLSAGRYGEENGLVGKLHLDARRTYASKLHDQTAKLPAEISLTPELAAFMGYYAAEGCAIKGDTVSLTFNSEEKAYIAEVEDLGRALFGLSPDTEPSNAGNWTAVKFHSSILAAFLTATVGRNGPGMSIPLEILEGNTELAERFLVAACRGDGGQISSNLFGFTVSNKVLAYGVFQLALKCGALPTWNHVTRNHLATLDAFQVILAVGADAGLLDKIGKGSYGEESQLTRWKRDRQRFWGSDGLPYYAVKEVTELAYGLPVWDIQVEEDASFSAAGVAAHNCYIMEVQDSLESIFDRGISDSAKLAKFAGGLGGSWTKVRGTGAHIKGTNGESQGVIPFLKVYNDMLNACNQGGKRRGSGCNYLATWHNDIEDFLDLRKNVGDDRRRCHDMNTAHWIPDLFMKRMEARQDWTLFRSSEVADLTELYGAAFDQRYEEYEAMASAGKIWSKTLPALELWKSMLKALFETGHPWLCWSDPCNVRSPQDHYGVIHSSNLCTEITLVTNNEEVAVCNLGSVLIDEHLLPDGNIDRDKLKATVTLAVRALDNVIDINFYPVEATRTSNSRHRPIGLGMMGLQNALHKKGLAFASQEAVEFNDEITEAVAFYAYLASSQLAREKGTYSTYKGSKWDRGILPQDSIDLLQAERGIAITTPRDGLMDWTPVREHIAEHGMRNSNVMAIAPTATISNIMATTPCIEPNYKNLFVKSNMSGDFTVLSETLVRELKALGLWSQGMLDQLKYHDGELSAIAEIPDEVKARHLTVFGIPYEFIIDAAARRQKWIDQSQSLNLFLPEADMKTLSRMYRYAWSSGLKTTYYLRTLGASGIEKSTVDAGKALRGLVGVQAEVDAKMQCSIDNPESCEMCQ